MQTINLHKAKQNIDNNESLLETLLTQFVNDNNDFSNQADILISNDDFITLIRKVHTLKGLAGTLGLERLQQCAVKTEKMLREENANNIHLFKKELQIARETIKELLLTYDFNKQDQEKSSLEDEHAVIDEVYSLALASRPIPSDLKRHLDANNYDAGHCLFKLTDAINHFDYQLVISIIETYKANLKH